MTIADISYANTVTSITAMLAETDGVIMRIGYRGYGKTGRIVGDTKFKGYADAVTASGRPWGVYFVDQAVTPAEAVLQADWISRTLKKYDPERMHLGVWCDSEYSSAPDHTGRGDLLSRGQRTQCVAAMLERLTQLGYKNGIYASNSWLNSHLNYERIKDRWIWNAAYGVNDGTQHKAPSRRHDLHQYTSRGRIAGVAGYVDLSSLDNPDFYREEEVKIPEYVYDGVDYAPIFDPVFYSDKYADLKLAFGSDAKKLFAHFTAYGMNEGRQPGKDFIPQIYRERYEDLDRAFGDHWPEYYKHYILFGIREGRSAV